MPTLIPLDVTPSARPRRRTNQRATVAAQGTNAVDMSKRALASWAEAAGFRVEMSRQFEMGLNLLLVGRK